MGSRGGIVAVGVLALGLRGLVGAQDFILANSHLPYAPMDVKEKSPSLTLSNSERRELAQEFRGLLAMGQKNYPFSRWSGKPMADCYTPEKSSDRWRHKCEIITGQGNGYYYFYDAPGQGDATLLQVDVVLQTSDEGLIRELQPTLWKLFGRKEIVVRERPGYSSVGPIRHWNTGEQVADLFMDASKTPNGTVRFVWTRGPLVDSRQARLP